MGKFSNKAKSKPSKRKTLKQKYKIERKVREFKRKTRKTARKLRATGSKKGGKQEVTLPNLFPFKTEVLDAAKKQRDYQQSLKKSKRAAKGEDVKQETEVIIIDGKKQFRSIDTLLNKCDVIIEVLDARDPNSCRNKQLEENITKTLGKKLVLILNKIDLVPYENACSWQKYLNAAYPTVMYRCNDVLVDKTNVENSSVAIGHGYLLHLIRSIQPVTVGVIGLPGVGKASFIQSLLRVGRTSTLSFKEIEAAQIQIDKQVNIVDSVGVTEPTMSLPTILKGSSRSQRVEQLVGQIVNSVEADTLHQLYKIPNFAGVEDFLKKVAKATGQLQKGGVLDIKKTINLVCEDWSKHKMTFHTAPPHLKKH